MYTNNNLSEFVVGQVLELGIKHHSDITKYNDTRNLTVDNLLITINFQDEYIPDIYSITVNFFVTHNEIYEVEYIFDDEEGFFYGSEHPFGSEYIISRELERMVKCAN